MTNRRNKFVCSKISSSMSAMWFSAIFLPAQHNVILTLLLTEMCAAVGSVFVCNHMESALFTIICNHGNQPLMKQLPLIFFPLIFSINIFYIHVLTQQHQQSHFVVTLIRCNSQFHLSEILNTLILEGLKRFFSTC